MQQESRIHVSATDFLFEFEIKGRSIGRAYASIAATDANQAKARLTPLFPGCELIPLQSGEIPRA